MVFVSGRQAYDLDDDLEQGIKQAVANNQLNLAMHYLLAILDDMNARIEALSKVEEPVVEDVPEKKAVKKTGSRKKAEPKEESTE